VVFGAVRCGMLMWRRISGYSPLTGQHTVVYPAISCGLPHLTQRLLQLSSGYLLGVSECLEPVL